MRRVGCAVMVLCAACASSPEDTTRARAHTLLMSAKKRDGDLEIFCEPPDAEVALNGVPQGRCDDFGALRGLRLGEGIHQIEVQKHGFWPYKTSVSPGGARTRLRVQLSPLKQGANG
jgi:hypothetical protein